MASGIWLSEDKGENWYRKAQYTHPLSIKIDPRDSNKVHVTGIWEWGDGGMMYSSNKGRNFTKNEDILSSTNGYNLLFDKNDGNKMYYTFFGSGMVFGNNPIGSNELIPSDENYCLGIKEYPPQLWIVPLIIVSSIIFGIIGFVVIAVIIFLILVVAFRKNKNHNNSSTSELTDF